MENLTLTTPQQNIWNLQKLHEGTAIGNIAGMITFSPDNAASDPIVLDNAINKLIENADALRLRLSVDSGTVRQSVAAYARQSIPLWDFTSKSREERSRAISDEVRRPFEVSGHPLYRFFIVRQDGRHAVFMVIHHLICDGWSANLIANLISEYATAEQTGAQRFAALPSYTDFIRDGAAYRDSRRCLRDKAYWDSFARTFSAVSYIKPGLPKSDAIPAARYVCVLSEADTAAILRYCDAKGISPDALYKTAVALYLFRINHVSPVVLGTPVINRDGIAAKRTVGMYVSTMPVSVTVRPDMSIDEILAAYAETTAAVYRHCRYALNDIQASVTRLHPEVSRLYDVMVSYENSSVNAEAIDSVDWFFQGCSENALTLHIDDRNGDHRLEIAYDYRLELFPDAAEAALLSARIQHIIAQIIENDRRHAADLSVIPPEEYHRIVFDFNDTASPYPRDACLHELFEAQVRKHPQKCAVVCDNRSLSFLELDHMANNLAAVLDLKPGEIAALYMHRSEMILVAQLAVLKSGGIFLPIDLSVPPERINAMLSDCQARYLITSRQEHARSFLSGKTRLFHLDDVRLDRTQSNAVHSPVSAEMGAHIIYTSGSTGTPKGSVLTHRGLVNFAYHNLVFRPDDCPYDATISINTISFDMFLCETVIPLAAGITVHIATERQQTNQALFAQYVIDHDIQLLQTTPTRYKILTADKGNLGYLNTFRAVALSGEPFPADVLRELRAHSGARIFNTSGPSENHIWICGCALLDEDITLGHPIRNTQIYIMDERQQILPIGVPGELCVSGDCIGLGYLNRPELNKEKYVPHPFFEHRLLYRTADLALLRPDGVIEPHGRIDTQVKIRGMRVELGEIESLLCEYPGISNAAAVVLQRNGTDFLCAFYKASGAVNEASLKSSLSRFLPHHMVPNLFIPVEAFPMTPSGKISRKALAQYDISAYAAGDAYRAPASPLEAELCAEFERVLQCGRVSSTLDFFAAGGNSLHIIDMLSHLPESYRLTAKDVYANPTPAALAACIHSRKAGDLTMFSALSHGENAPAVFCIPYAGGNDASFWELSVELQKAMPRASVYALRRASLNETAFRSALRELEDVAGRADGVILYSHCAGSALSIKLYQHLAKRDRVRLIIGANTPPRGVRLYGRWFNPWMLLRDRQILKVLTKAGIDLGSLPQELQAGLVRQFREDAAAFFREMSSMKRRVPTDAAPIVVVSDADVFTPDTDRVKPAWDRFFDRPAELIVLHGADHYFQKHRAADLSEIIRRIAQRA
ncbi:MAG: amino acid adenylation domain-containing protein [Oscillospiraceae bacterium]|nr:amino acid adenylation domain-containing protein [Oscillospiraceae bacterium]